VRTKTQDVRTVSTGTPTVWSPSGVTVQNPNRGSEPEPGSQLPQLTRKLGELTGRPLSLTNTRA
jgi:hypothetical protein